MSQCKGEATGRERHVLLDGDGLLERVDHQLGVVVAQGLRVVLQEEISRRMVRTYTAEGYAHNIDDALKLAEDELGEGLDVLSHELYKQ